MEMTKVPSKEVLLFCNEVSPWIKGEELSPEGVKYIFKDNTPREVLVLLDQIKNELDRNILN